MGRVVARLPVARIEVVNRPEAAKAIGMVASGDTYVLA
jgi:hypothetical protein